MINYKKRMKKNSKGLSTTGFFRKEPTMVEKENKKGLSTIVATLLIILLTLVAVGVIWTVVRNVLQTNSEQISLGKFTLNLEIAQVQKINDSALNVIIKRNKGQGDFVEINFLIYDGNDTEIVKINSSLKELEVKAFELYLTKLNVSELEKISIIPIFQLESGKKVVGDIKDEYSFSSGISVCVNTCPVGAQCGDNGCGGVCGICPDSTPNCENYQCSAEVCIPNCTNKQCGYDGCDGICGVPCILPNASSQCNLTFQCEIISCNLGYANCDSEISNGCETILGTFEHCFNCSACDFGQSCIDNVCVSPTPTCSDGIQNQGETGIDCGGPCLACPTLPTCSDGIQNQGETGIDCGGPCNACPTIPINSYLRTFYVSSSSGNDANPGNFTHPWKTIAKVNSYAFLPGDGILFKRGDSWFGETLVPSNSGNSTHSITFSTYGTGNKPIITGFTTLTTWTDEGGGIYSKVVATQTSPEMVLVNGVQYEIGRWPNEGTWRYFESHVSNISITDNELAASPDWTGAEVVIRVNEWSITRNIITNHDGNTITYIPSLRNSNGPYNNWGYFIQNDLRTLDKFGEWYYNNVTKRFYMYFGSANPNNYNVQIPTIDDLISFTTYREKKYIVFDNLALKGANMRGIFLGDYNDYALIKDCEISFVGDTGIEVPWSRNCAIINTTITNSNAHGISSYARNMSVRNCIINNTGTITGLGLTSTQAHIGIYTGHGHDDVIENNKIYNSGYSAINFAGNNSIIKNNLIDRYCFNEVDGGGIYFGSQTATFNMTITGNIILNGVGAVGGKPIGTPLSAANGIYIDYNTRNGVRIYNNTVSGCVGGGIFIHESPNIEIMDNTVYNCTQAMRFQDSGLGTGLRNITMKRNIFFAKYPSQLALWAYSSNVGFEQWGNFDYNYYARPIDEDKTISAAVGAWGVNYMSLSKWNTLYKQDNHSHISPKTIPYYSVNNYLSSNKFYNGNFTTNISGGIGCWNGLGNCILSWDNTKLDGGALKISFNSTVPKADSILSIPVGTVTAGKDYILKYSLIANKETNFDMINYLRKLYDPWTHLTNEYSKPITTIRTENEVLLSATITDSVSAILFEIDPIDSANNEIWIDNVELYEADVTITNPDDYIRFEYNPTNANKVISLSSSYVDVTGKSYSGSVTLKPYSSIVLIKN